MTAPATRSLSIFDLDRTLTRRPTYFPFLLWTAAQHAPLRLLFIPAVLVGMVLHKTGLLSRKRLKEVMHASLLGGRMPANRLARFTADFVDALLARGLYARGVAQLARDREMDRMLVLATAAPDYYANALAARLGFHAVISTRYRRSGDTVLARIEGSNCYGHDKLHAIEAWLGGQRLERATVHVRFYSDDASDLPTFEWADEAIAVNPRLTFKAFAGVRGWTVLNWRETHAGF